VRGSVAADAAGLTLADLTPELAKLLGYPEESKGVAVVGVARGSPAARSNLRPGMLLLRADGQPVRSAAAVRSALDRTALGRGVLLQVVSPQGGVNYALLRSGG